MRSTRMLCRLSLAGCVTLLAVSAIKELAQDFQGVNLSDPQQLQQLEQQAQPAEGRLVTAGQHIESYVSTRCGAAAGTS